jgi:hypothetical protein
MNARIVVYDSNAKISKGPRPEQRKGYEKRMNLLHTMLIEELCA